MAALRALKHDSLFFVSLFLILDAGCVVYERVALFTPHGCLPAVRKVRSARFPLFSMRLLQMLRDSDQTAVDTPACRSNRSVPDRRWWPRRFPDRFPFRTPDHVLQKVGAA